jgi:voltage-gated potassium channel
MLTVERPTSPWRRRLHEIIFESDTRAGRWFDVSLIWLIVLSIASIMLESVASVRARHGELLRVLEWGFTIVFTVEYLLRLVALRRPRGYALSFFGITDLLSVLPTYLSLLFPGVHVLLVVRIFRLLRLFRIFKLVRYVREARVLQLALSSSRHKISVFLTTLMGIVITMGALMHVIEGEENGFTSIPRSVYWAIITLTTVGYGDLVPRTPLGQALASFVMILGYAVIAVPTGIVSIEIAEASRKYASGQSCPTCGSEGHDIDASYCKRCGGKL